MSLRIRIQQYYAARCSKETPLESEEVNGSFIAHADRFLRIKDMICLHVFVIFCFTVYNTCLSSFCRNLSVLM